jgi:hypothetical protein
MSSMQTMYIFTFVARPNPKRRIDKAARRAAGAYVNAYIVFKDSLYAEKLAKEMIRDCGWISYKTIDRSKYFKRDAQTKKARQYYREAITYGHCLVFHCWPKNAPDRRDYCEEYSAQMTQKRKR